MIVEDHRTWIEWYKSLCKIKRQTVAIDYCIGMKVFTRGYMKEMIVR